MPNVQDFLDALPTLSASDRAKIVAAARVLGTDSKDPKTSGVEPAGDLLWRGFCIGAEERGLKLVPVSVAQRSPRWKRFAASADGFDEWVRRSFEADDESERRGAWRIVASCILRMLSKHGLDWTPMYLYSSVDNVTVAVEDSFPGYADSGLLRGYVL